MTPISIQRFREYYKIEEERSDLMHGMGLLSHARRHLEKDPLGGGECLLAMKQMDSLIGPMENRNRDLAEKGSYLWNAILELDGAELTSPEIDKALSDAQLGVEWLDRLTNRVCSGDCGPEGQEEARSRLVDIRTRLSWQAGDLRRQQDEYQWAMAEVLSHGPVRYEN